MPPEITIEDSIAIERQWDDYASSHPQATFFHSIGWRKVLERTFPYQPIYLAAQKNGLINGILPLYLVPHLPFGRSLVSMPIAVYGGICANDAATAQALLQRAQEVAREKGVRYLEIRNQESFGDLPVKDLYVTFKKPIDPDPEKNLAAIPRNQRRSIRQAQKFGLTYKVGGEELLRDFFEVYSHSVRNLGSPVFPLALFKNLLAEFGPACRILGVFKDEKMIAGVLTFFFRDQVLPYYGGALREAFKLAASDFMYWSLMGHGAEHGYKVFDFGRSKKESGAYHFKRHWGFEPSPLAYQYYLVKQKSLPNLNPQNPKFSLPIALWKKLPLRFTQWLGPKLVKYFP